MNRYALLIALSLLTQLPLARWIPSQAFNTHNTKMSVLWYPATAIIIAALLTILSSLAALTLAAQVQAIFVLIGWVALSGGIHLDGVADCTDAASAGHADRSKILSLFKTPEIGAMAAVSLILLMLSKAVLIFTLIQTDSLFWGLLTAIVWSRCFTALYMLYTPYARKQGLGIELSGSQLQRPLIVQLVVLATVFLTISPSLFFITASASCAMFTLLWRRFWLNRISGYVGDCAGAAIEWMELICLFIYTLPLPN